MSAPELDRLRVVLVRTRNPLNIGAAARAMSNFGLLHLRVVNPYNIAFREARSAVGAPDLLARAEEYERLADAIADCTLVVGTTAGRSRTMKQRLRPLEIGARSIRRRLLSARVALLFGSEKTGLSNGDFSHCHWLIRIPTVEPSPSMNLGQAVALCLYELSRPRSPGPAEKYDAPTAGELERTTQLLIEALSLSQYTQSQNLELARENVRRLIRRLKLPADDAGLWLGMLRQIVWKLKNP